ncbi:unnamed protein product [Rotaria sp. Silwood1]|nr:unnamed protein product [Rotaria sp. Silwood1]CAF1412540.1 unnamed protein product [Rotaria sp. Silwood1]
MTCCFPELNPSISDLSPTTTDLQLINDLKEYNSGRNGGLNTDKTRKKPLSLVDKVYVAIYDYDARTDEDLTFWVGDLLTVLDDRWFHGHVLRKEAEHLLLNRVNSRGTFLVQYSEYTSNLFYIYI